MAMVDEFLDQLTEDYTALYKENASLKAKMKVLADSLEEYRATEKGMRRALLAAQQAADEMVKEAESRKGELIRDAEADAQARIAQLRRQINDEEARLSAAQTATAEYVAQVREACRKQEASLDKLDSISAPAASSSSVEQTAQAIEQSVQRLIEEEEEEAAPQQDAAEPVQEESGEEPSLYEEVTRSRRDQERERSFEAAPQAQGMDTTSPTRRIDFDNLQFGSNYDLK
jgi:cell division initiation protein